MEKKESKVSCLRCLHAGVTRNREIVCSCDDLCGGKVLTQKERKQKVPREQRICFVEI